MKVIFLDIDGVICVVGCNMDEARKLVRCDATRKLYETLNKDCIAALNEIVNRSGAKVVISSSWRRFDSLRTLKRKFKEAGFIGMIIDVTPVTTSCNGGTYCYRGNEIQMWLNEHPEVEKFVIIDDETSDMLHLLPKCYQTPGIYSKGLAMEHIEPVLWLMDS